MSVKEQQFNMLFLCVDLHPSQSALVFWISCVLITGVFIFDTGNLKHRVTLKGYAIFLAPAGNTLSLT